MTTIKDVPMLSADQKEILLNSVLYTAEWSSGYEFKKEGKVEIEAHRVISVDNSNRFFRTRCVNGCETKHEFSKGCGSKRLYGDVNNAKKEAFELIDKDLSKCEKKLDAIKTTKDHIVKQRGLLKTITPREPKKVTV